MRRRLPDSRLLVFPIQYSRLRSAWVNYWEPGRCAGLAAHRHRAIPPRAGRCRVSDDAARRVTPVSCRSRRAPCEPAAATFREGGINCEMCHGPSLDHVERLKSGVTVARRPRRHLSAFDDCRQTGTSRCARSATRSRPCTTRSRAAPSIIPKRVIRSALTPSSFRRRSHARRCIATAATARRRSSARRSRDRNVFAKGTRRAARATIRIRPNAAQNPTSLKFATGRRRDVRAVPHDACANSPSGIRVMRPNTEASRCVSCHMPRIMEALLFQARSHEIDDIPDAEMTERFGNADSPNACVSCHADRDAAWLRTSLAAFRPAK